MRFSRMRLATPGRWRTAAIGGSGLIAAATVYSAGAGAGPVVEIHRSTIDAGGGALSAGGELELLGTVGQPDAGALSGNGFTLAGGFWFGQAPGDSNGDGGIDLFDYRDLEACASGPDGGLAASSCAAFDIDGDQDVDLEDVGEFQRTFSGS